MKPILHLAITLTLIAGGIFLGKLLERILLRRLTHSHTPLREAGLEAALRGTAAVWFATAFVYGASLVFQPPVYLLPVIRKGLPGVSIIAAAIFLARCAAALARKYAGGKGAAGLATIFANFARACIMILGALTLLQFMGISIAPLLAAFGIGGLAVALAMQDTLGNLFAGLSVVASRGIRPGDYIRLPSGEEGRVLDVAWRHTTLASSWGNRIVIPNSRLASMIVINCTGPEGVTALTLPITVQRGVDLALVERVTREAARAAARETPDAVPGAGPELRFLSFTDGGVTLEVALHVRENGDRQAAGHVFVKRLNERYRREGLEITGDGQAALMRAKEV